MKILAKLLCKHPNRHYLPRSEVTDKACMKCDTCGKEWKFKP